MGNFTLDRSIKKASQRNEKPGYVFTGLLVC